MSAISPKDLSIGRIFWRILEGFNHLIYSILPEKIVKNSLNWHKYSNTLHKKQKSLSTKTFFVDNLKKWPIIVICTLLFSVFSAFCMR